MPNVPKPEARRGPAACPALPAEGLEARLPYCRSVPYLHGWLSDGDMEKSQKTYLKRKGAGDGGRD